MISFKCKNCGAEMSVDSTSGLFCEYCGTKVPFSDGDLADYRNFRLQVLNYLRSVNDSKAGGSHDESYLWRSAETLRLRTDDKDDITVRYLYSVDYGDATAYLARNNVLFVFKKGRKNLADRMISSIERIQIPAADMKGLRETLPEFSGRWNLEDGGTMVSFVRADNIFPLDMFGCLRPEHAAWIVSRLENIACVLNYSGLVHQGISVESVFINPFTHHAVLFGPWWNVQTMGASDARRDLADIRVVAGKIMGPGQRSAPREFVKFIKSRPCDDSYGDFEAWDKVIESGFGGRRFAEMNVNL